MKYKQEKIKHIEIPTTSPCNLENVNPPLDKWPFCVPLQSHIGVKLVHNEDRKALLSVQHRNSLHGLEMMVIGDFHCSKTGIRD